MTKIDTTPRANLFPRTRLVRALALSGAGTFALIAAAPAAAECTVDGMGNGSATNPSPGSTITCGAPLATEGVGGGADDVTVDILDESSAGLSTTGESAITLGNGATVTVGAAGQVVTSGDNALGMDLGDGAMVTVDGTVSTSGENSDAIKAGDMATIDVSGTVRTGGGTSNAINVGMGSTVNILAGGDVRTGNSNSSAILLRGDDATVNVMADALVTTSSGMSNPILAEGNGATIMVAGEVRSSSGNSDAIAVTGDMADITVADGGFVTAQSSGSDAIGVTGTGATITVERGGEVRVSSGNSAAIRAGEMATVNIAGTVGISSSSSQGVILGDGSTLNVQELGLIETSSSESQAVLVSADAMTATINVARDGMIDAVGAQAIVDMGMTDTEVTIDGMVFGGSSDPVIAMGGGNDTLIVNGTVRGSSASPVIDMGAGDDTTTINSNMTVEGPGVLVAGGTGDDTLNLANGEMYTSDQFTGNETVNNSNGGTYTVNDDQSMQTVNSDGEGSQTNVDEGGSVMSANSSNGGTTNVNEGGRATNTDTGNGGTTNVNNGGQVDNSRTRMGGTTNVNEGGMARNVSSDMGGTTNVNSGGMASLADGPGGGGAVNFRSGSSVETNAQANGMASQRQERAGVTFENGVTATVANSPFFTAQAAGTGITLTRGPNAFAQFATGRNTASVAAALDTIGATGNNPIIGSLVLANPIDVPAIYNNLTGELYASSALGFANAARGYADILLRRTATQTTSVEAARRAGTSVDAGEATSGPRIWLGGFGRTEDVDVEAGGLGFNTDSFGAAVGAEFAVSQGIVGGISVGYSAGQTDIERLGDRAKTESYHAGAYVGTNIAGADVGLSFAYGNHDADTTRIVRDADETFRTRGRFDGETYAISADAGYDIAVGTAAILAPVVSFNAIRVEGDFSEVGAGFLNQTGTVGDWLIYGGAGVELGGSFAQPSGNIIRPSVRVMYERAFEENIVLANSFNAAAGVPFAITGFGGDKDRVRASAGLAIGIDGGSISFNAETTQGSGISSYGGGVRLSVGF